MPADSATARPRADDERSTLSGGRQRGTELPEVTVPKQRPSQALPIWEEIHLLPNPLPEIDQSHIDTRCRVFSHNAMIPVLIEPDGSRSSARPIALERLAGAADRHGMLFSFGDLQPAFDKPSVHGELRTIRDRYPSLFTAAELPASRLLARPDVPVLEVDRVARVVAELDLKALILDLDGVQQSFHSTYGAVSVGVYETLGELSERLSVPIVPRSIAGLPRGAAKLLYDRGARGFMVGGAEVLDDWLRTSKPDDPALQAAARERQEAFRGWGIPTVAAIRMLRSIGCPVISDGRIETGLNAVKALTIGANVVGFPLSGSRSGEDSEAMIEQDVVRLIDEVRTAMFLCGATTVLNLPMAPFVAVGETREWLEAAESLWRHDGV
jgi:isopentenyl-diphosphate Delta-isomerase